MPILRDAGCRLHQQSSQDDVVRLLEQYKKLALHYEALRAAVSVRHVASSEAAEPPVVLPPLSSTAEDVVPPASEASPEASPGSMLKLLNPFTRVPRAIKGTLSLLDGTTSLIPASAVAAWSTAAPKANLTLQEIPAEDVPSASQGEGANEWHPEPGVEGEAIDDAEDDVVPEQTERPADSSEATPHNLIDI